MRPSHSIIVVLSVAAGLFCTAALAQSVYVTRGENGPVFSDKPQAGAKEMTLKPLTVVPAASEPSPAAKPLRGGPDAGKTDGRRQEAAPPYRSLAILAPENNGSVLGDTSQLEVRLAVDPPLLLAEGHAFVVRANGRLVDQRFTATEFILPPDSWPEGYLPSNRSVQLEVSIVDGSGQVVMRAAPIQFFSRQIVVQPSPYPTYPPYPPYPPHFGSYPPYPPSVPPRPVPQPEKRKGNAITKEAPAKKKAD